jgi:hypothetical protein
MTLHELLNHPAVRGVCIGSCVDGSRFTRGTVAHAHYDRPDTKTTHERYPGFICLTSLDALARHTGDITRTGLEELAHLIAKGHHGKRWVTTMREMGQPIPAMHRRKPKRR